MSTPDIRRFVDEGRSILIGTVDALGEPHCCRAVALTGNGDLSRITVYVPVDTAQQVVADVATTHRVAVVATQPLDHSTVQFKGSTRAVRLAGEDERELVAARMEQFADILETIGVPRATTERVSRWPAYAIEMDVEAVFDQTPGPRAGAEVA